MKIRSKITAQFISIVALILLGFSMAVYFFSADYREENFYNRLRSKSESTAKLLLSVEEVDAGLLKKIERNNPTSLPFEVMIIFDERNDVIYSSDSTSVLNVSETQLNLIRHEGERQYRHLDYEILGYPFRHKYDEYVVVIGAIDIFGLKKLGNLRLILIASYGVSILIVILFGWIFSGRALRPISSVIQQVDNITISSLNLRVDEGNGQDEIAMLAATFNNMLARLESAFKMQKNFIANASHELRTPLTIIAGQLEVLLLKDRSTDEYKKSIASVLEDMRNLNTVSNRLLLLAQASSETTAEDFHPVRVDDMLWQAISEITKHHPEYRVNLTIDEKFDEEKKLLVSGNEQLIKTVFLNLIENGCKYSPDYQVNIDMTSEPTRIAIAFRDRGIGIPRHEIAQVFEPFHRASNSNHHKGHGLGLSLVKRIMDLHGGEIRIQSEVNKGTTCAVYFPVNMD